MAWSLGVGPVAVTDSGNTTNIALTGTISGHAVIAVHTNDQFNAVTAASVNGQAMTLGTAVFNGRGHAIFAYLNSLSAGGNHTVTFSLADFTGSRGYGATLTGSTATDILDDEGVSTSTSVSLDTTQDNSAIFTVELSSWGNATPPSGYTLISMSENNWYHEGAYNLDVGAAGTKSLAWSGVSGTNLTAAMALKLTDGGGGGLSSVTEASVFGATFAPAATQRVTFTTGIQAASALSGQASTVGLLSSAIEAGEEGRSGPIPCAAPTC